MGSARSPGGLDWGFNVTFTLVVAVPVFFLSFAEVRLAAFDRLVKHLLPWPT